MTHRTYEVVILGRHIGYSTGYEHGDREGVFNFPDFYPLHGIGENTDEDSCRTLQVSFQEGWLGYLDNMEAKRDLLFALRDLVERKDGESPYIPVIALATEIGRGSKIVKSDKGLLISDFQPNSKWAAAENGHLAIVDYENDVVKIQKRNGLATQYRLSSVVFEIERMTQNEIGKQNAAVSGV